MTQQKKFIYEAIFSNLTERFQHQIRFELRTRNNKFQNWFNVWKYCDQMQHVWGFDGDDFKYSKQGGVTQKPTLKQIKTKYKTSLRGRQSWGLEQALTTHSYAVLFERGAILKRNAEMQWVIKNEWKITIIQYKLPSTNITIGDK